MAAELFTQAGRPAAYMIGGSVNWLSFFLIGMAFPFIVVSDDTVMTVNVTRALNTEYLRHT